MTALADESLQARDLVTVTGGFLTRNVTELLAEGYEQVRRERAADRADRLIAEGYIAPQQRDFAIRLAADRPEEFAEFVPDTPIALSVPDDSLDRARQEAEVARLTGTYDEYFDPYADYRAPLSRIPLSIPAWPGRTRCPWSRLRCPLALAPCGPGR